MSKINQIVYVGTIPVDVNKYERYEDFVNAIFFGSKNWDGFRYFSDDTYYHVCGEAKSHLRIGMCLKSPTTINTVGGWDAVITRAVRSGASLTPVYEGQWVEVHMPGQYNNIEVIGERPVTPSTLLPNKAKFEMYVDGKRYRLIDYRLPKKDEYFMETFSQSRVTKITRCLQSFSHIKCFIFEEVVETSNTIGIPSQTPTMTVGLFGMGRVEKEIRNSPVAYSTANERILAREIDNINRHLGRK